jgi:hypothetical protein
MPAANNISEGILGMIKAAHRKSPNADARSINGKTTWQLNGVASTLATMSQDKQEKVLQFGLDSSRCMTSTKDHRAGMATARFEHFQDQQNKSRQKEERRTGRTQAILAMQPARTKEELNALVHQKGASQLIKKHLQALLAQEQSRLAGCRLKDAGGASARAYYGLYLDCLARLEESDA